MRKLKLQVQIAVDGYVGGPDGDLDWRNWDDELKAFAYPCDACDTILLGRKMAEVFVPHFEKPVNESHVGNGDKSRDDRFDRRVQYFCQPDIDQQRLADL